VFRLRFESADTGRFGCSALDVRAPPPRNGWPSARPLLPVPYFHVLYTLPAKLRDIAYQNKAVVYDLLFKASAETRLTIAADPKHLGARIGSISVLHTWGSALLHHPHVHMICRAAASRRMDRSGLRAGSAIS
jgi:hypothetical protein